MDDSTAPAEQLRDHSGSPRRDETLHVDAPGAELYAEVVGPADAPAVYYLHGGPGYSSHSFRELMGEELEDHLVVYADARGGGRSYAEAGTSGDLETLAGDVPRVLNAASIPDATLVGHGFGAMVAVATAALHPERVTALVLIGPWLSLPLLADRLLAAAQAASGLAHDQGERADGAGSGAATADAAFGLVNPKTLFDALQFPSPASRLVLEHVDAEALLGPQEEDESDAVWDLDVLPLLPALERSSLPIVIIAGVADGTSYPEQVEAALTLLPSAMVSLIEGGHYPWLDDPETFSAVLAAALGSPAGDEPR